jgi:hypothetical protein
MKNINRTVQQYYIFTIFCFQVDTGEIQWPTWIETLTNISHLLTAFNSSVNFYIYLAKHWRSILGIPEPNDRYDTLALGYTTRTSVSHIQVNSARIAANLNEDASEMTRMLVAKTEKQSNLGARQDHPDVVVIAVNAEEHLSASGTNGEVKT